MRSRTGELLGIVRLAIVRLGGGLGGAPKSEFAQISEKGVHQP